MNANFCGAPFGRADFFSTDDVSPEGVSKWAKIMYDG
jgi:hypothetical protein